MLIPRGRYFSVKWFIVKADVYPLPPKTSISFTELGDLKFEK